MREKTKRELSALGFVFPPSSSNFILARHPEASGEALYAALRERGIIVRHFGDKRIAEHLRITVGSEEDMSALTKALGDILKTPIGGNN